MKDHFVKIAVTLIGKDKSMEIIRHICMEKKYLQGKCENYRRKFYLVITFS